MKLITLTLNPAFDVHCDVPDFAPYHENLAHVTVREAGGKGVNISRACAANGTENTALVVLGEENAADFRRALAADGLRTRELLVPGRIRENLTLHTEGKAETRISFAGFAADETLLSRVEQVLATEADAETIVTLTGRVPDGIPTEALSAFLNRLRARGVRTVIDSRSFSLAALLAVQPFLIKPNEEEIAAYTGEAPTRANVIAAVKRFHAAGVENSMASFGASGALLACRTGVFWATPPKIEARSTVGAGDSSIAGFLSAFLRGSDAETCLRTAVAYGSAACLRAGTRPPEPSDIARILPEVKSEKVE